ncbi:uncharacterized protein Tco025E_07650, partial [Trypanosoma conorhini]
SVVEAKPLEATVGPAGVNESLTAAPPLEAEAPVLVAAEESAAEAKPLEATVGPAGVNESLTAAPPLEAEAPVLVAAEESVVEAKPMSIAVGSGQRPELTERRAQDVKPMQVLSGVDVVAPSRGGGESSVPRPVILMKDNARVVSAGTRVLDREEAGFAEPKSVFGLSAREEEAGRGSRRGAGAPSRLFSAVSFAPNVSSERRIFSEIYPDQSFLPGSDVRPMVLVGRARVRNLTSATPERGVRSTEVVAGAVESLPLLSAVEGGAPRGKGRASRSPSSSVGASRREVRFAPAVLPPTPTPTPPPPAPHHQRQAPVRIQRQYETCQGLFTSWNDPAVMVPRPVLRPRRERDASPKPPPSELPQLPKHGGRSPPRQTHGGQDQPHPAPRIAPNTVMPQPTRAVDVSALHRRLGEVVARVAKARTPSPSVRPQLQQAMQYLLPAVPTNPAQRDALYRLRRQQRNAPRVPRRPITTDPSRSFSPQSMSKRPILYPTLTRPTFPTTNDLSQTGRFVGNRSVYYY